MHNRQVEFRVHLALHGYNFSGAHLVHVCHCLELRYALNGIINHRYRVGRSQVVLAAIRDASKRVQQWGGGGCGRLRGCCSRRVVVAPSGEVHRHVVLLVQVNRDLVGQGVEQSGCLVKLARVLPHIDLDRDVTNSSPTTTQPVPATIYVHRCDRHTRDAEGGGHAAGDTHPR